MPSILFLENSDQAFCTFRLAMACAAQQAGYKIIVAAAPTLSDSRWSDLIKKNNFIYEPISLQRGGLNPFKDFYLLKSLIALYKFHRPNIVHHFAIKPILYGTIAARFARVPYCVNSLTGLGYVFTSYDKKARILRWIIERAYRWLFSSKRVHVIAQNQDDFNWLSKKITARYPYFIPGSGVDTLIYHPIPEPTTTPYIVTMVARVLTDKGVREFAKAGQILKEEGMNVRMQLVGARDAHNPSVISEVELQEWITHGWIDYLGSSNNIAALWQQSHIAVLPSYREGLPKALLEAAACGRPLITTDVPGCRDLVQSGENGLLIPVKDPVALAQAIKTLTIQSEQRKLMGIAARRKVEKYYSMELISKQMIQLYNQLVVG